MPLALLRVPVGTEATPWPPAQPGGSKGRLGCPPWLTLCSWASPFHQGQDRGLMLGWILALVGDGLGRMDLSCPAAGPM